MLVHRKRRPRYGVHFPIASLIDIVFLLLVYFLLTTNFLADEGIDVKLPQAQAARPQTEQDITVYVDAQGRSFIENKEVSLDQLFDRLRELIGSSKEKLVVIRADRSVILNKAVQVMDVAKAAGAQRLLLATEKGL